MPKVDADFLNRVQEHCNGGLDWCEKRDIERLDLVAVTAEVACIATKEDAGMASFGVAMFKLGYEVARVQGEQSNEDPADREAWLMRETLELNK